MAASASRSRSDIEVLQSSNRSKFVVLAALVAVAGGAYYLTRGGPIGAPEELSSIMIVNRSTHRYGPRMEAFGFKVLEQRQAAFVAKAKEVMPEVAKQAEKAESSEKKRHFDEVATILRLADFGGYAYVVFEDPAALDFSGIEVAGGIPDFADHHRFAVVSAGDFAFPHVMTVTAEPSPLVRGVDLDLLTALFAQPPLKAALTDDPKAGPEILIAKSRLEEAIERVAAIDEAAQTLAKTEADTRELLTGGERGPAVPSLLGPLLTSTYPRALADGGVLLLGRDADFSSRNGLSLDLALGDTWRFTYHRDPTSPEGQVCGDLLGGEIAQQGGRLRFRAAPTGDALLLDQRGESRLFTLADGAGPCGFTDRGVLPRLGNHRDDPGIPHASGWVARARHEGREVVDAVVELIEPGDGPPIDLLRSTALGVAEPVWLDHDHLAVIASYRAGPGGQSVLLLSRHHPGVALELGPQVVAGSYNLLGVTPARAAAGDNPRLVVVAAGPHEPSLFRVDLPAAYAELFTEAAPAIAAAAGRAAEGSSGELPAAGDGLADVTLLPIDPARFAEPIRLTAEGAAADPVVSPDGAWVAYVTRGGAIEEDRDYEIAVVATSGDGEPRLLTRNSLDDRAPHFTADSKHLVFETKYPVKRTSWTLTVGRALALE